MAFCCNVSFPGMRQKPFVGADNSANSMVARKYILAVLRLVRGINSAPTIDCE